MLRRILIKYKDIISSVERVRTEERYNLRYEKAKLILIDGSELHISQVWIANNLEKYSYYWLDEEGEIITGWDNAPHHKEIDTFPHHKHKAGKVLPSKENSLEKVLFKIKEKVKG